MRLELCEETSAVRVTAALPASYFFNDPLSCSLLDIAGETTIVNGVIFSQGIYLEIYLP